MQVAKFQKKKNWLIGRKDGDGPTDSAPTQSQQRKEMKRKQQSLLPDSFVSIVLFVEESKRIVPRRREEYSLWATSSELFDLLTARAVEITGAT